MNWDDLRYFLAVAETGTLTAAAHRLEVERTTVSRRISALEKALGLKLFERTPDSLVLSQAGERVLEPVRAMERAALDILRDAQFSNDAVVGNVKVAVSEAYSGFIVKNLVSLQRKHKGLVVEVLSGNQYLDISRREADLAIRMSPDQHPDLIRKKLGDITWALYAAEGYLKGRKHDVAAPNWSGHDVIGWDASLAVVPGAEWITANIAEERIVFRGNSFLSVLQAALSGMGVAALPCFMGDQESTLRRLTNEIIGFKTAWLIGHPDVINIARVRTVADFLIALFAEPGMVGARGQKQGL